MNGNEEFEKVIRHKEEICEAVRELGKSNWPTTIVHNDLVEANIGRCGGEEGTFFFFDGVRRMEDVLGLISGAFRGRQLRRM